MACAPRAVSAWSSSTRHVHHAIQDASLAKRSSSAPSRRSASSLTSITILAVHSLVPSCLGGRRPHPREPSRAGMTSPSGRGPLAMTPTIPPCSRATRSRPVDKTLPSIVILLWMLFTHRNWDSGFRRAAADLPSDSPDLPDAVPLHHALQPNRALDRAQGDAQLPAQQSGTCSRHHQHLGVVVRQWEVLGEGLNSRAAYFSL